MHTLERFARGMRHAPLLRRLDGLWDLIRPLYDGFLRATRGRRGLVRVINGTDEVRIDVGQRNLGERYEPEVWRRIMTAVRSGDTVADVGAFVGLYSIAIAKRIGEQGKVVAFEPDATNSSMLRRNIELNGVAGLIEVHQAAVGPKKGEVAFASAGIESHVLPSGRPGQRVPVVALDDVFSARPVHILKIDVEGFEDKVLLGARRLLADPRLRPRAVFIEVHPFAWGEVEVSAASLLSTLAACGYRVRTLAGEPISKLENWGEIIAEPEDRNR